MSQSSETGFWCALCKQCVKMQVLDSRTIEGGRAVRRRRRCAKGHRYTTYERHSTADVRGQAQEALTAVTNVLRETASAIARTRKNYA